MIELLSSPEAWIAFATLTALELVLGIDNIIFISILVDKLPKAKQSWAWWRRCSPCSIKKSPGAT
jgi:predicted tellurium resistance membrane protein TerC